MFLRDAMRQEIPPQLIKGAAGQQVFHTEADDRFGWNIEFDQNIQYVGEILGPIGSIRVISERIETTKLNDLPATIMDGNSNEGRGIIASKDNGQIVEKFFPIPKTNQLALQLLPTTSFDMVRTLRDSILSWRIYHSFDINTKKIRRAIPVEQDAFLEEDAGNLSAVLHYLLTEHRPIFNELESLLRSVIPDFEYLTVKARGGPGEVIAFWRERGLAQDLSLADLSDGILRFLCWATLCLHPNPPSLICIDEPDQGLHPRTLSVLAGLMEKASQRTQILVTTHNSYFLTQFELNNIAVVRKVDGGTQFIKPTDSQVMRDILEDFGADEIERLHRTDELELLP